MSDIIAYSRPQSVTTKLSAAGAKGDVENALKLYFGPTIQPKLKKYLRNLLDMMVPLQEL